MSRNGRHLFTSESVTEGHPDKIADQISDSILDAILAQDPIEPRRLRDAGHDRPRDRRRRDHDHARTSTYQEVVRDDDHGRRLHPRRSTASTPRPARCCRRSTASRPTSRMGVDTGGAGDQGLMFGYACTETDELMPLPIMLAHKLVQGPVVRAPRRHARLPAAGRQVAGHRRVRRRQARSASTRSSSPRQHSPHVTNETLREDITEKIINRVDPGRA